MKLTKEYLNKLIAEEIESLKLESIWQQEENRINLLHEQFNLISENLDEGILDKLKHVALDVAGAIPGIGEAADLTNALLYAKKGEYLQAALSAISMIPGVGDAIGKGGKLAIYLGKAGKIANMMSKHIGKIKKVLADLKDVPVLGGFVDEMEAAVMKFINDLATENPKSAEVVKQLSALANTKPASDAKGPAPAPAQ